MTIVVNRFPEIILTLPEKVEAAIEACCIVVEHRSAERARVESGAMKAGFRHRLEPGFAAVVWNEQPYAIYNEFGTRYMSAQPMVRPAVEETVDEFVEALAMAFEI